MEDIIIPREAIGCDVGKIMDEENLTIPELIKELKQKIILPEPEWSQSTTQAKQSLGLTARRGTTVL